MRGGSGSRSLRGGISSWGIALNPRDPAVAFGPSLGGRRKGKRMSVFGAFSLGEVLVRESPSFFFSKSLPPPTPNPSTDIWAPQ